jgi:hexokinase
LQGLYLAVDLGGTNFRVCSIQLLGDTTFNLTQSKVAIPKELMVAKTAKELFAFLALQIEKFLKTHHEAHFEAHVRRRSTVSTPEGYRDENIFRLGFTFSFPVHQTGIASGNLIRWTKGFDIQDAVGKDVCQLLQTEIDALKLPVKVAALVNDTVGTLMARAYTSPGKTSSLLGAIFGTGTNGAYVEKLSNITKKIEGAFDESTGEMIVNTEWGSFDNSLKVLKLTKYDKELDAGSVNPGIQMFEKLISGMFLGEILRVVIVEMHKEVGLLRHENSSQSDLKSSTFVDESSPLHTAWGVDSSVLSIAQADNSVGLRALRQELKTLFSASGASLEDAEAIKTIAAAIAKRAARLAGSAIAGIVLETGRLKITDNTQVIEEDIVDIGVDGSLVEFYPGFEDLIREALRAVNEIGPEGEKRIRIGIAKDGSGVGAALIALVADKSMLISPDFPFFFKKKLLT